MDIVVTGKYNPKPTQVVHKVLRPGYKLYIGSECNDGRPITESLRYKEAIAKGIPIIRAKPVISKSIPKKELFTTKYAPKSVANIIGHKEQISQILTWFQNPIKGILLTGPPGIGKTTMIHLIAKEQGYNVTEYNASDTRSITMLKGILALGMKRLVKEVIVMDEVDGLSSGKERGSIGEIAELIRKSPTPIICIANDKSPKLKPIISVCIDIKCNRPMKTTIATALLPIVKAEEISLSKTDLEQLCEKSGNDIRSILNTLDFYESNTEQHKDSIHRLDLFSATHRLMSAKQMKITDAEDLVYVDYHMIPLMVQEAYTSAAANTDELEKAANLISEGDVMNSTLWNTQDWTMLPQIVTNTVAIAKTVSGPAPFQIFPQFLGKNSKRQKHVRWMDAIAKKMRCNSAVMRLDYAMPLQQSVLTPLQKDKPDIKGIIERMEQLGITRDDVMETLCEVSLSPVIIPTKTKTAFTREWNKRHSNKKVKKDKEDEEDEDEHEEEDEDEDEEKEEL